MFCCATCCIAIASLYLEPARRAFFTTWKTYTPALPFTGFLENLPAAVAATAPERAGSAEPVACTKAGAAKVICLSST